MRWACDEEEMVDHVAKSLSISPYSMTVPDKTDVVKRVLKHTHATIYACTAGFSKCLLSAILIHG